MPRKSLKEPSLGQRRAVCSECGRIIRRSPSLFVEMKPADAIVTVLRELDRPIGIAVLRRKLEESGYPQTKLGRYSNYFYTTVSRLIANKKITRLDGDEIMLNG